MYPCVSMLIMLTKCSGELNTFGRKTVHFSPGFDYGSHITSRYLGGRFLILEKRKANSDCVRSYGNEYVHDYF